VWFSIRMKIAGASSAARRFVGCFFEARFLVRDM
jgi:hypothetical protein